MSEAHWMLAISLTVIAASTALSAFICRREYRRGLKDGAAAATSAAEERSRAAFERGRKAGMRETARELAQSELPALRIAGENMMKAGWGE